MLERVLENKSVFYLEHTRAFIVLHKAKVVSALYEEYTIRKSRQP